MKDKKDMKNNDEMPKFKNSMCTFLKERKEIKGFSPLVKAHFCKKVNTYVQLCGKRTIIHVLEGLCFS